MAFIQFDFKMPLVIQGFACSLRCLREIFFSGACCSIVLWITAIKSVNSLSKLFGVALKKSELR